MTVTLEIPPEMEAQLCDRAARRGQTVTDFLMTLAESEDYYYIHDWEDEAEHREEIAVVEQRLADVAAGEKGVLLADYRAEVMAERASRTGLREKAAA